MRNLAGHKVLLILRNPGGTCRNIYGREQLYPRGVTNTDRCILLCNNHLNLINYNPFNLQLMKKIWKHRHTVLPALWVFRLWTFALTEIIKHDQKIHDTGHKFIITEMWDNIKFFKHKRQINNVFSQNSFLINVYLLRNSCCHVFHE
jgi:hypothetical protein